MYPYNSKSYLDSFLSAIGSVVIKYPTGNCQWASISNIEILINLGEVDFLAYLKDAYQVANQNMFLFDIHNEDSYKNAIEKIFKGSDIVLKQEYISTNESEMILYLVKTDILARK